MPIFGSVHAYLLFRLCLPFDSFMPMFFPKGCTVFLFKTYLSQLKYGVEKE